MSETCYVYTYHDPSRDNEPIYVGKGSSGRAWSHLRRRDMHPFTYRLASMKTNGVQPIITIYGGLDDELAMLVEEELISKIGRKDLNKGPLLNLTNGGDGACGKIVSTETRSLMSRVRTGEKRTQETCQRISAALKGRRLSDQARVNISAGHVGVKYPTARNDKISASLKGHVVAKATREKISQKAKARSSSQNSMFGRVHSEEARQKIGEAVRAAAARRRVLMEKTHVKL